VVAEEADDLRYDSALRTEKEDIEAGYVPNSREFGTCPLSAQPSEGMGRSSSLLISSHGTGLDDDDFVNRELRKSYLCPPVTIADSNFSGVRSWSRMMSNGMWARVRAWKYPSYEEVSWSSHCFFRLLSDVISSRGQEKIKKLR
jgi:hypothetical protein